MTARRLLALAAALALTLALAGVATARMSSTKLGPKLCETTGGGKFVDIPWFPGEMIDRRLLRDIKYLRKRYSIFVTDGYSMDDVHASNGEHPLGLALDIVPDKAAGGTWNDIDRLAAWAEPEQNQPRPPFRWVGYDGDANHGRGNHLHLSFGHSVARPGRPAKLVQTIRCPQPIGGTTEPPPVEPPDPPEPPAPPPPPPSGGTTSHGHGADSRDRDRDRRGGRDRDRDRDRGRDRDRNDSGGVAGVFNTGGVKGKLALAPVVAETGGVGR